MKIFAALAAIGLVCTAAASASAIEPINAVHTVAVTENEVYVTNAASRTAGADSEAGFYYRHPAEHPEARQLHIGFTFENDDTKNRKYVSLMYYGYRRGSILPEIFEDKVLICDTDGYFKSSIDEKAARTEYAIGERRRIDCIADMHSGRRRLYIDGKLLSDGTASSAAASALYPVRRIECVKFAYRADARDAYGYAESGMRISGIKAEYSDSADGAYFTDKPVSLEIADNAAGLTLFNMQSREQMFAVEKFDADGNIAEITTDIDERVENADGTKTLKINIGENVAGRAFYWGDTMTPIIGHVSNEPHFAARLTIANTVEFEWDSAPGTVSIFDGSGRLICEGVPRTDGGTEIHAGNTCSDSYRAVFYNGGKKLMTVKADCEFIMPRKSRQLTTLQHPYMLATPEMLENVRTLCKTNGFYRRSVDNIIARADEYAAAYRDFSGVIAVNPIANYGPVYDAANACSYAAIAYQFEPKPEYVDTAYRCFLSLAESYRARDYLMQQQKDDFVIIKPLCEAYDLLYNYFSDEQRRVIEDGYLRVAAERMINLPGRGRARGGCLADIGIISIAFALRDQQLYDKGWYDGENGHGFWYQVLNGLGDDSVWWEQSPGYHEGRIHHWGEVGEYYENAGYDFYGYVFRGNREGEYTGGDIPRRKNAGEYADNLKYMNLLDGMIYRAGLGGKIPAIGDTMENSDLWSSGYITYFERIYHRTKDKRVGYLLSNFYGRDRDGASIAHPRVLFVAEPEIENAADGLEIADGHFAKNGYNKLGVSLFGDLGEYVLRKKTGAVTSELWVQSCDYGTVSHSNADKLGIVWDVNGEHILCDAGTYDYYTAPRREYAKLTAAHNTVIVDGKSQAPYERANSGANVEFAADENGEFTGGELDDISIGPRTRAVGITNNNCYAYLNVSMQRTLWQIDDYIIDCFNVKSPRTHEYVYPMHIAGEMYDISMPLTAKISPFTAYGRYFGVNRIKNLSASEPCDSLWQSRWSAGELDVTTTMLGGEPTAMTHGYAVDNDGGYTKPVLLAKRTARDTCFVTVMDTGGRAVEQLDAADGVYVCMIGGGDLFLTGSAGEEKSASGLTTDASGAFMRKNGGKTEILGIFDGAYAVGGDISIAADRRVSLQLTETAPGCLRLDTGGAAAHISIGGAEGMRVFDKNGTEIAAGADFAAAANEVYFIAASSADIVCGSEIYTIRKPIV